MENVVYSHGDVLFVKVSEIPGDCKKLDVKEGFVVEKGEGIHTHILKQVKKNTCCKRAVKDGISPAELNSMLDKVEVYEKGDSMYIKVKEKIEIDHEEHGTQTLDPGIYRKEIERQFDYENEVERRVRD